MLAIARRGAWDSLASGITTTADYSFSGDAARAASEIGLRAIVYLEVFAQTPGDAERQYSEKRAGVAETDLVRIGVSPHAPYTCSADVYAWCLSLGIPVGTHLAESASENAWLVDGSGPLNALASLLVPPTGRRSVGTLEELLGPDLLCAHCVDLQPDEIALLAAARRPDRALPAVERTARLRDRPAARIARCGRHGRPRNRLAGVDAVIRHVRRSAHRDHGRARP